jgi:hypothetical protein
MSLNLEWGAVAGAAPTYTVAIGFKQGSAGFDMQHWNNQAREQTEASLYAELVKLAPFLYFFFTSCLVPSYLVPTFQYSY